MQSGTEYGWETPGEIVHGVREGPNADASRGLVGQPTTKQRELEILPSYR